jgi:uncharacterized protein (DUF885 family)
VPHYDPEVIEQTQAKAQGTRVVAVQLEAKVATARRDAKAAIVAADKAVETRIKAGIRLSDFPPQVSAENEALAAVISSLALQAEIEKQRGDAWMAAAIASQEAADAARNQLEAVAKAERRKGLKWGLGIGAGAILILAVLI